MRKISILGSTGSIGTQTLSVIKEHGDIEVVGLSCGKNIELLEEQIRQFMPSKVSVWEQEDAMKLKERIADLDVSISYGMDGLLEIATHNDANCVVTAVVGMIGILPTIEAIKAGKDIALANKETLVCAGHLIMPLAKEHHVQILPVDSEHSAIFQSLQGNEHNKIAKILLTASGGPFRGKTRKDLENISVEQALNHPNWSMGKKVTIDSSTLVNKGLEMMEAYWLFGVAPESIQVLIHPQSILHSAVEYEDGSVIGQLGVPDMRLPIQYALYYPNRISLSGKRLDLFDTATLSFEKPDLNTFLGLTYAYEAISRGGNVPTIFNAANEKAVALFLAHKISYLSIYDIIKECMENISFMEHPSFEQILQTEQMVYNYIECRW